MIKRRSPSAKALSDRKFRQRVVAARVGRGSSNRKKLQKAKKAVDIFSKID